MNGERLRVEALGSVRAWLGEHELDLGPARQRAVFAALATRSAVQPMTRAELVGAVWGDAAPASAAGSVHTYISGLRRVLDPERTRWSTDGLLVSDATGYRLLLDDDSLDVQVFERLRATAGSHWRDGDAARTVEVLDHALALWSGEALSGVPGPYAESLRTQLGEHRLLALELRAAGLLELGSHEDLVAELAVLVREHPLREPLWGSLMIALHRGGRTTEALGAFHNAREILWNELAVAPSPELADLHRQILTNDPTPVFPVAGRAPAGRALLSVLPGGVRQAVEDRRTKPQPCHGREAEIATLRRLTDDVLNGRGRIAWVEGEPGIGKSELLTTALADAGDRGCHVAWATASELGQLFPLQTIMESLGADAGPAVADRILAHVDELCATAPMVMVLDSLHWADEASVLMWNRLSAVTRQLPLLLVAATRPAPRRQELAKARRAAESRGLELITLGPLTDPEAENLVGDLIGARLGEELRSLVRAAAGNPLYLREVTGALAREGLLEIKDGIAEVREGAGLSGPQSLLGAIDRTLIPVDELTRETLRRAATLGMEFGLAQVAAAMGKLPSELLRVLEDVMEMQIIIDSGTQLAFRHPVLRWALYNEIPGNVRAAWHRRAAEALAQTGSRVEQVAQQLVAAPIAVDDWMIDWLAENHDALSSRAPLTAAKLLFRVLDAVSADDPRRQDLAKAAGVRGIDLK